MHTFLELKLYPYLVAYKPFVCQEDKEEFLGAAQQFHHKTQEGFLEFSNWINYKHHGICHLGDSMCDPLGVGGPAQLSTESLGESSMKLNYVLLRIDALILMSLLLGIGAFGFFSVCLFVNHLPQIFLFLFLSPSGIKRNSFVFRVILNFVHFLTKPSFNEICDSVRSFVQYNCCLKNSFIKKGKFFVKSLFKQILRLLFIMQSTQHLFIDASLESTNVPFKHIYKYQSHRGFKM